MGTRGRSSIPPEGAAAAVAETGFGWVCAVARNGRLVAVSLPAESREAALASCVERGEVGRPEALLEEVIGDLLRYFAGERVDLGRHPVDLSEHPPFRRRALLAAREIPYGEVRPYAWVAAGAGKPGAARAAGQAMARNPLPLVVPCHRVVGSGGGLGGFGGGLDMKRRLLELEGIAGWRAGGCG